MWKIIDESNKRFIEVIEGTVLNVGNVPDCNIQLENKNDKKILIQVILESNFIYFSHEKKYSVHIDNYEFSVFGSKFKIESINNLQDIYLRFIQPDFMLKNLDMSGYNEALLMEKNYYELQHIYSSSEFLNYLSLVQKYLSESKNFISNNYKFSTLEVVTNTCKILDPYFWKNRSIFEKSQRNLYKKFIWLIWAHICEYGILSLPLHDPHISEIMVNESKKIYFEVKGVLVLSPLQFNLENDLYSLIERICSSIGRRIDESMPYCDARLKDGSRIHAIIPPLALNGPCLTIRKFPKHEITPQKLIDIGSVPAEILGLLKNLVLNKKNILISGGTGSGKTTLLNCLSSFIPQKERIITIEDSAELKLQQEHVIRLESRTENGEKKGKITMRDLVKNSLRMRPDRIIVGECRGEEALDMLQAMNTGHDGSMTTVHANSPADALRRLETLVLFAEFDLPSRAVREQITSAIQYVVQQSRLSTGHRCVTAVHEIVGLCDSTGKFLTKIIYAYEEKGRECK